MKECLVFILCYLSALESVKSWEYENVTEPAALQLLEFKQRHPKPIGVWTTSAGAPVEIRDSISLNSDMFSKEIHLDSNLHLDKERIPERIVHAKGSGAYGYFEVTNDVSKYTKADVFNGIGKKTPVTVRLSTTIVNLGGNDLERSLRGLAIKFYTKEGNLDLVCLNVPVFAFKDPHLFFSFVHAFRRNPSSNLLNNNARWDFLTKRANSMHTQLWLFSDFGIPDGYRRMDAFPIHTYELNNEYGDRYYVRFNFRTLQGLGNLTRAQARFLDDPDYLHRDTYNAIEQKNYPAWRLEMDVLSLDDIKHLDFNPFDLTRLWKEGTYHTVTIGRLVLNKNPDNFFKVIEQSAFNPASLVPGIPGPVDAIFRARRLNYRDTQNYRLGINHDKISINQPLYAKTYLRDGKSPINENMKDAPNYYPNSFNGPLPYVDESRPEEKLIVLENNAVDLQHPADFYNTFVRDEAHRKRLATNIAEMLNDVYPFLVKRALRLLTLIDTDLGRRVREAIKVERAEQKRREEIFRMSQSHRMPEPEKDQKWEVHV